MNRWYAIIPGCLVLYVTSPVYAADSASRSSVQPTGGEPPLPLLPTPVEPNESILSQYTPQAPPDPKPPPYTLLRFNEDYRYLVDPRTRTDFLDPLKYIPLNASDPASYLTLGGEIRERYEHYTNPSFGVPGQPHTDDYLLQRIALYADLHVNDHLRFFVQGISGLQFGGTREKAPTNQDPVDLQQAFLDLKLIREASGNISYLIVRGGRFEMSYGAGRLVATRAGPNIPFKFDGLQLIGSGGGGKVYAFVTKPAREREYQFDDEFPGQLFWGVYGTTPSLGTSLPFTADLYYLGLQNPHARYASGAGHEERQTFGTRWFGKARGFDYDVEPILQVGRFGQRDILAWTVGTSSGYTLENTVMTPRLGVLFDVISGNTGQDGGGSLGTFNPLYFKAGYFNDASLIRPSNLIDIHPTLQLLVRDNVLMTLGSDVLWRYTPHDGVYGPPGNLELLAGGHSRYVATTAEISAQWLIDRHVSWITSYVHFFTGKYVRQAHGKDVDYIGSWVSLIW
ncbi:MAG TPA: alginate export family protein [Candidatus Binatia bacterium]|nr:alginate export family protein [Candidatus Binatia bacterium]